MNKILRGFSTVKSMKFIKDKQPLIKISELPSGIKIFTEQTAFPFASDIGICFKAGLRNELPSETGSLFSLNQHMYHISENDCLENFEQTLRTGCMLDQTYDSELSYWKCQFIQEDFDMIVDVLLKLALTTKRIAKETRDQFNKMSIPQERMTVDEAIKKAAFGTHPLANAKTSAQILPKQEDFSRFQEQMLTSQNMIIGYAGVWSHEQFREYIEKKLVNHQQFFQRQLRKQTSPEFLSQICALNDDQNDSIDIALLFKGNKWSDINMPTQYILNQILGSSSSWSTGGPGKGMRSRTTLNLMQSIQSVEEASGISQVFSDAGILGLRVQGPPTSKQELYSCLIDEFRKLGQPMSDEEFLRGKNIAITLINLNLERQADRLEEQIKTTFLMGQNAVPLYESLIQNVTKEQLQDYVKNLINNAEPTLLYYGKNVQEVPTMQQVKRNLRK
ncbi:unnamed protein product [Paramecium pentaurelia]|uniref:Peptidase M16 C-terminal domain-containing protein n=1 Tax=Paramecium pentaurelia TaxID=43138 RepID=A0A8S1S7G9_9CILI|nr:unnamed protein product [Paramecium pentaurelia]